MAPGLGGSGLANFANTSTGVAGGLSASTIAGGNIGAHLGGNTLSTAFSSGDSPPTPDPDAMLYLRTVAEKGESAETMVLRTVAEKEA